MQIKRSKDDDEGESDGNDPSNNLTQMLGLLQKMQGKNSKFNIQINF
jgi:hypothetical protein